MTKSAIFLCVLGRSKGSMSKSVVFVCVFWVKCCVFACFLGKAGHWAPEVGRRGEMSKSVMFLCVFWVTNKLGTLE